MDKDNNLIKFSIGFETHYAFGVYLHTTHLYIYIYHNEFVYIGTY